MLRLMLTAGPGATVETVRYPGTETYALRVLLGAEELVLGPTDGANGTVGFARFLSRLAEECSLLATVVDPLAGRHSLSEGKEPEAQTGLADWYGESGPGRLMPEVQQ
jgi:hypothetical protein